jgi:lipopolysaccharide export system protein LptA
MSFRMRRRLVTCLLLAAGLSAQQSAGVRGASGASLSGFSEDAKAEKAWEIRAATLVPRAGSPGRWDLSGLVLTTYREGRVALVVRTAKGEAEPERRAAEGAEPVTFEAEGLRLQGRGWTWRGLREGDAFALLAEVRGNLRPGPSPADRVEVVAGRVDASPLPSGVRLAFSGGVTLLRSGERLTCDRVDCDLGPGSELLRWVARGGVRHVAPNRTLQADEMASDLREGRVDLLGSVRVVDAEAEILATSVSRETATGRLTCRDDTAVQVRLAAGKDRPAATLAGRLLSALPMEGGGFDLTVEGDAAFAGAGARLAADRLALRADPAGKGPVEASGNVRGTQETLAFTSREARLDRARGELVLRGDPLVRDTRGLDLAGSVVLVRLGESSLRVDEGPGVRAALRGATDGGLLEVEAARIEVRRDGPRTLARMSGAVALRTGETRASCRTLSLAGETVTKVDTRATPGQPVVSEPRLVLGLAQLEGEVRLETAGVLATAGRAELHPAVGTDLAELGANPLLVTLLPGEGASGIRPRLEIAEGDSISAFESDRQEVLLADAGGRFWLRGNVALRSGGAEAACQLLEGAARREPKSGMRLVVARGTGEVRVEVEGNRASGKSLELDVAQGRLILRGEARVSDRSGRLGLPAETLVYDTRTRDWRMDAAPGPGGELRRPRVFLPSTGLELPLPQ